MFAFISPARMGAVGAWGDDNNYMWRIIYLVLSFCLATSRCMNLEPSFL